MSDTLRFDESEHRYFLGDRELTPVTKILKPLSDFSGIPADILERAREWGKAVHKMIELDILDTLDEAALSPALIPMLKIWREWRELAEWVDIEPEKRVYSAALGYAGTLDLLVRHKSQTLLVDIKTSSAIPPTVGPQTAAYTQALDDMGYASRLKVKRSCLHLTNNARLVELKDQTDFSVFQSCLNLYHWRQSHEISTD